MPQALQTDPHLAKGSVHPEDGAIPQIRWVIVGYFFWVGIFLGAVIMRAATHY